MTTRDRRRTAIVASASLAVAAGAVMSTPAGAMGQSGFVESPVGYYYDTFGAPPIALLAGGTLEEFCENNPADPFMGEPGTGLIRVEERNDGSTVIKGRAGAVPMYLYEHSGEISPPGLPALCEAHLDGDPDTTVVQPFASGTGKLRIHDVIDGNVIDAFNSVKGQVVGDDGTVYRVSASADLQLIDFVPQGDPTDFVKLDIHEIGG